MITEVSPLKTVVLDSSGNGQCALGPPSGTWWAPRLATMSVSTSSKQPQALLYRGSPSGPLELVDSTYAGAFTSSGKVAGARYFPGQLIWAKWIGGDPAAIATLQVYGQQGNRSDPFAPSPVGEGFPNPIVATLIVGTPGNPQMVINVLPIPAELVTYYAAGAPATFVPPDTVVEVTINYDGRGNYAYQAMLIDSSASPVTSVAFGVNIGGTVNEVSRVTLNPSGGGSSNTFYEHSKISLHTGSVADLTFAVLSASQGSDINADRLQLLAGGALKWGPGGTNQPTDTTLYRAGAGALAVDDVAWNNAGAAETWHNATLLNGWTNRGAGFPTAGYRRLAIANCAMLCGQILPGTLTDNTVIFNVPAGYRPASKVAFAVGGAAGKPAAIMAVDTSGDVSILQAAAATALQFSQVYPLDR